MHSIFSVYLFTCRCFANRAHHAPVPALGTLHCHVWLCALLVPLCPWCPNCSEWCSTSAIVCPPSLIQGFPLFPALVQAWHRKPQVAPSLCHHGRPRTDGRPGQCLPCTWAFQPWHFWLLVQQSPDHACSCHSGHNVPALGHYGGLGMAERLPVPCKMSDIGVGPHLRWNNMTYAVHAKCCSL